MLILAAAALAGCDGVDTGGSMGAGAAAPTTRPTSEVMAIVNGRPLYMHDLHVLLVEGPGPRFAEELVRHELVRQAAAEEGITVAQPEMDAEHQRLLAAAFPTVPGPEQRERLLEETLRRKMVCRRQWDLGVRTSVLLRKMVSPGPPVSEEALREEFGRQYGRKVVVRHIQVPDMQVAEKVLQLIKTEDFAEVAMKYSLNPSGRSGGLLPPIGPKTAAVHPAMRQTALEMKAVGEVSDLVQVGTTFHILKLEQIIEPKNVKFADVRDELAAELRERQVRANQNALLSRLIREGTVRYVSPALKAYHDDEATRRGSLP
jgi:parvulin-like peptidyl-prolyl isomerase